MSIDYQHRRPRPSGIAHHSSSNGRDNVDYLRRDMYPYHTPPYSPQIPGDHHQQQHGGGVDRRSSLTFPATSMLAQGGVTSSPYLDSHNNINSNGSTSSIGNGNGGMANQFSNGNYSNGSHRFIQEDRFNNSHQDVHQNNLNLNLGRQDMPYQPYQQQHPHPNISSFSSRESSVGGSGNVSDAQQQQRNRQRSIAFQEEMFNAVKRKRSSLSDEHAMYLQQQQQQQQLQQQRAPGYQPGNASNLGPSRNRPAANNVPLYHPSIDPPTASSSRRGSGHATSTSDDDVPNSTDRGHQSGPHSPTASSSSLSKKPRLIKACEPCRLRKIGCDGTHPVCQRCKADDRVGECRFIRTIVRSSLTRKRMTELEEKLDRWERLWAGLTGEPRGEDGEGAGMDPEVLERIVMKDQGARGRGLRARIVEGLGGGTLMVPPQVPPPLPQQLPGNRIDPNLNNGSGSASGLHSQHPNVLLDPPVPIPNYLHPSNISLPTPLPSTTSLPLNLGVSLPTTAPSTAPPSPRTAEWAHNQSTHPDPQIDKNLDGTGSFTRKGGSGSSYLGLSSGVTFLNAILKLCKERGGIFIDVENTMPGPGMGGGPGPIEGSGDGPKGSNGTALGLDIDRLDPVNKSGSRPGSPGTADEPDNAGLSNAEIVARARTLPPKEEYMPFVDSYFEYFHGITPMVHEPTVRATLTGKIPFPKNDSYLALIYMIFAMGALDSVAQESDFHGQTYCDIARAILNNDIMESGSVELVQAIAILANYLQRNDKPNAGYLCLGAAVRMAIGIGLHVHDNHAKMSPLEAEMRKRVWWSIALLESGCSKTFGRPSGLCGVNLSQIPLPSNIDDEDLTSSSERLPPGVARETLYSTLIAHSKLARATTIVHTSILQLQPAPSLDQIKQYDRMILQVIGELPSYITYPTGPVRNNFSRHVLLWRLRDWRATLFRPILLAAAFDQIKEKHLNPAIVDAISICRSLAAENLSEMGEYIRVAQLRGSTRAEEWYCMYLSHQSSLTLLLSLVGEPAHVEAEAWRGTILATATWFRQLKAMKTAGTALAAILENVTFATASFPIREQTSITPTDNWLLNPGAQNGQAIFPNDALDVMRYWNALCPEGATGPVWDDSIWNAMFSMNPDTLG